MAETIDANYRSEVTVTQTLDSSGTPSATDGARRIVHAAFNAAATLSGTTSVPVSKYAGFTTTLSAGAATINLAALAGTNGVTVDGTGLKLQLFRVRSRSTNTAVVTVAAGASNPYNAIGASFTIKLDAGQDATFYLNEKAPDIASGARTIDLSSSDVDAIVDVDCVMG